MLTPLGAVGELVALIKTQLQRAAPALRPAQRARAAAPRAAPQQDLPALVARRVQAIGRDDPERGRKAFRAFLESLLLQQLGAALQNDPAFHQMVDDIQRSLEQDHLSGPKVQEAMARLLNESQTDET